MKRNILLVLFAVLLFYLPAQAQIQYEPLKIGEKVPDFEFAIQNYHSPTARLSDFKGKLVILDFWSTDCVSCFYSFPKMEMLQKQFGDKIQIILVNFRETEKEVEARMKIRKSENKILKEMPSVINNVTFSQIFPHQYAGHYVWIDKDGILRLTSPIPYNNNVGKIKDVLDGKKITFLKDGMNYNADPSRKPLITINNKSYMKNSELGSLFTPINLRYFPSESVLLDQLDTITNTIRNTYINKTVLFLYNKSLDSGLYNSWKTKIYGPNRGYLEYLDYFHMLVKDSSIYDKEFVSNSEQTDDNMVKSYFCYEQVLPQGINKVQSLCFMREDLDRYFGLKYETKFTIEEVLVPCYFMKKLNREPISVKTIKSKLRFLGEREYKTSIHLESIMNNFFRKFEHEQPYVFDVDELDSSKEIIMPVWKKGDSLEDFKVVLELNGLKLEKGKRLMKKVVVRDNQ